MADIRQDYMSGGSGIAEGSQIHPGLSTVLRDIADDLEVVRAALSGGEVSLPADLTATAPVATTATAPVATTATAPVGDIPAFTDPPSAAEMAVLRTTVNELSGVAIELLARQGENRTLLVDLLARQGENRTLLVDLLARQGENKDFLGAQSVDESQIKTKAI